MKINRILSCLGVISLLSGVTAFAQSQPASGSWKTIYYKRVFVGSYQASWVGDPATSILRQPIFVPFEGTKARVWLRPSRDGDVVLAHASLAPGSDPVGGTDGRYFPLSFGGAPGVQMVKSGQDFASDEAAVPLQPGTWYLQQRYTSDRFLYTQDNDGVFRVEAVDQKKPVPGAFYKGSALGNVCRIDVFTGNTQTVIACYGDSITQGLGATPGLGKRYPELLGYKVRRPVLNLGVNGDLAKYVRGLPSLINSVLGVDSVVFVMGINDIITGSLTSPKDFAENVSAAAASLRQSGRKFYIGTIPPAGGYSKFDDSPSKEELRQAINAWIRASSTFDGVIDFDAVLRDEAAPSRMRADSQSDWLHPNDTGYERMAEAAARVIQ
jgi:lysophospholipase L1-like esterase